MEAQLLALAILTLPGAVVGARAIVGGRAHRRNAELLRRLDEELAALQRTLASAGSPTDPLMGEDAFLALYRTRHAHPVLDSLVASGRLADLPAGVVNRVREARAAMLWWEELANDLLLDLEFEAEVVDVGEGLQSTLVFLSALEEVELRVEQLRESLTAALGER